MKKLILALVLFAAPLAQAQILLPQDKGFAALLLGSSKTSHVGDGSLGFGAEMGLAFTSGVQGLLFFDSSTAKDGHIETQILQYGLGFDWGLPTVLQGLRFGGRIGLGTAQPSGPGSGDSKSALTVGPVVGYDYMIGNEMSLGASAQLLWTTWSTTETTASAFVVAKYWF